MGQQIQRHHVKTFWLGVKKGPAGGAGGIGA